ncbi:kinase-like protein [Suillus decipiens]|nr:kinase-like protein [Suillus decipiens]
MIHTGSKLLRVPENSTDTDGPLTVDQQRFIGTLEPSPLTTSNITPSTQLITSTVIPDLTGLITRCIQDPISGGTYGNIYKCIYHGPEGDEDTFRRELGIWKRLRHSNILKFMGTASDFVPSVALVAPWMSNGTLTSFLEQNNETLGLHDRLLLSSSLFHAQASRYCCWPQISCKTNVLIDGDRKAYLADFSLSGTFKKLTGMTYLAKMTCRPGAVRWAAPELLSEEESASGATTQSDMYSFSSIMLQVLTGNVPWCHLTSDFKISYQSMSFTDRPPIEEAVQFVDSALHPNTSPKTPTSTISSNLSASPQTPTLSISSDERHPGITPNGYLRGDTDARMSPIVEYLLF